MKEKRDYIRIEAPITVSYRVADDKDEQQKQSVTREFSEGGIHFPIYEKLKVGTVLELHIETPFDTIPVSATGQISWMKSLPANRHRDAYDVGVQFTKMLPFDRKRIEQTAKRFLSMGKKYRAA